jgi:hypothetical protein
LDNKRRRLVELFAWYEANVDLRAYWSSEFPTLRNISNYIKDGLSIDSPVAYLQYYNPVVPGSRRIR